MKLPLLLAVALGVELAACSIVPGPYGTASFWGDYTKFNYSAVPGKGVHLTADTMSHSPIVRAHWHGIANVGAEAVAYGIGAHGGSQAIGAVTAIVPPIVSRHTSRATPTPHP